MTLHTRHEVDFGMAWRDPASLARARLSWRPDTAELYLHWFDAEATQEPLAHVHCEGDVRALLEGWEDAMYEPGIPWLRERLEGLGA